MMKVAIVAGRSNSLIGVYASTLSDAVLRHRARQAEEHARLETQLANKIKSEFISNMSHELRTPLNSVIGFSKLISEHETRRLKDQDIVDYARLIQDAANHLLSVINDILEISKLHSGSMIIDPVEVYLSDIVEDCVMEATPAAEQAGLTLSHRIAHNLPALQGDPSKMRQVIANLLSNAIKFTPHGGSVSVEAHLEGGQTIVVSVRDTGVGMSADEIAVAMAPFGQVDAGRARWREGTGLGLPIAKALVELHGGTITIESERGRGTDVWVRLPVPTPGAAGEWRPSRTPIVI